MKNKIIELCRLISIYAGLYMIATIIFIAMFHTSLFQSMDVLMYRGILFLILSGGIAALLMLFCMRVLPKGWVTVKDVILLFCGCCCVNMVLFTLIPVTVELSVSVFMLSYMDQNEELQFTQKDIEEIFVEKYVKDYGAFEKRFHEQLVTGSIQENEDWTYCITSRGKQIVTMFRMIAKWFQTDQRLVYPDK